MVKVSPFHALIPHLDFIAKVPTKTYSQYSKKEIQLEIKNNPYSFLNIINQKDTLNQKSRFINIKQKFKAFKDKKILVKNNSKSIYIYRQTNDQFSCTGLICGISLNDYGNNKIKRHEKTIQKREILFAEYLSINQIHAEPVLIAHDGHLNSLIDSVMTKKSKIFNMETRDKVRHEIWEINNLKSISSITNFFKKTDTLYIADGHHRMASSFRNNKNQMCLAYIVSKNELKTHAFHRLISNIHSPESIIKKLNNTFKIKKIVKPNPESSDLQFYNNNYWYALSLSNISDIYSDKLQVTKLLQLVLKPIFGIKDERKSKNVRFIPGNINIHHYIQNNVKQNDFFFFMKKINMNTIIKIAKENNTTPPKSTFVLPKIPSGLIMMEMT